MLQTGSILEWITILCKEDFQNRLPDGTIIFTEPLVGLVAADDPELINFKNNNIIGPAFRLPSEWLPGAKTVVSYFLPFSNQIRQSNYCGSLPSVEWLHGRFIGESFNEKIRTLLVNELIKRGGKAMAPLLHKDYRADYDALISSWSERHIAYAAGLGTFGLHRGLITEKGTAGRIGSVITDLEIEGKKLRDRNPFNNCPYLVDHSCGVCIDRCPAGAINREGMDKKKCYRYMFIDDRIKCMREQYNYEHSICGKCQIDVPCEDCIP
ncbi:MAG: hypothetical protein AVO34_06625 [Firmicutes bacterium ML8_F2]|jgi:epoxyqueuosine reductase|nr:MAG: hypothetical protein AVO34_06625 [Firmicutes bacterium ML8_F2]